MNSALKCKLIYGVKMFNNNETDDVIYNLLSHIEKYGYHISEVYVLRSISVDGEYHIDFPDRNTHLPVDMQIDHRVEKGVVVWSALSRNSRLYMRFKLLRPTLFEKVWWAIYREGVLHSVVNILVNYIRMEES